MIYGYARVSTGHQDNSAHARIAKMVLSKVKTLTSQLDQ